MKYNNFLIALILCMATQPSISLCLITKADAAKKAHAQKHDKSEFKNQKNMILEWAQSKTPEQLNAIKDTTKHLNPREGDTSIQIAAKQVAKEELFPALETTNDKPAQSWWQRNKPQFMQNASDYVAKWIPQSIKSWSDRKKFFVVGAILASLVAVGYNKKEIMLTMESFLTSFSSDFYRRIDINNPENQQEFKTFTERVIERLKEFPESQQHKIELYLKAAPKGTFGHEAALIAKKTLNIE